MSFWSKNKCPDILYLFANSAHIYNREQFSAESCSFFVMLNMTPHMTPPVTLVQAYKVRQKQTKALDKRT